MHYDIIGDIHGQGGKLRALLRAMEYDESHDWRPPAGRQAIFVGDLIDRGPEQVAVVNLVRGMIDRGYARTIMGNHEFNALGFVTPRRDQSGEYLRRHSAKNVAQHAEFLHQVKAGSTLHHNLIDWFKTLPVALDLGGIRVVHAWWHQPYVDLVMAEYAANQYMSEDFLHAAHDKGSPQWQAMEGLTKGLETPLPEGFSFLDHDGFERTRVRSRWWLEDARTYRDIAIVEAADVARMPALDLPHEAIPAQTHGVPVFVGHYWMTGTPVLQSPTVACLDYSAARHGPLVGYRWQGEAQLSPDHFVLSGEK